MCEVQVRVRYTTVYVLSEPKQHVECHIEVNEPL